jgi:hypothetical protein
MISKFFFGNKQRLAEVEEIKDLLTALTIDNNDPIVKNCYGVTLSICNDILYSKTCSKSDLRRAQKSYAKLLAVIV